MKLLVKDVELISSKRPIDNAMLPPPLRPWQRTLNLTDSAMELIEKLLEKLIEKDVELFWGYLYPFCNTFFTFFGSTSALVKREVKAKRLKVNNLVSLPDS